MKKIYFTLTFIVLNMVIISAQEATTETTIEESEDKKSSLEISGSVDAYYRANLNADYSNAPGTSFANLPGFSLGMANLVVEQEYKNVGFTADFVVGPRGEDATFLSPTLRPGGSSNIINQLYLSWNINESISLTMGNFNTFLGYEVISPTSNFNYSTSYLFSYGPFSHTGIKADFDLGKGFSLMTGVFNPTDATEYNPTNEYAAGLQLGYENDKLAVFVNGLYAKDYFQVDLTTTYNLTEKIMLGLNASTALDNFTGVAAYFQVAATDNLSLGLRAEHFQDQGLGLFSENERVLDFTISAQYKIGNLTIIPEIRYDSFSEEIIQDGADYSNYLSSALIAVVYGF